MSVLEYLVTCDFLLHPGKYAKLGREKFQALMTTMRALKIVATFFNPKKQALLKC
jgi:hypothetical protein